MSRCTRGVSHVPPLGSPQSGPPGRQAAPSAVSRSARCGWRRFLLTGRGRRHAQRGPAAPPGGSGSGPAGRPGSIAAAERREYRVGKEPRGTGLPGGRDLPGSGGSCWYAVEWEEEGAYPELPGFPFPAVGSPPGLCSLPPASTARAGPWLFTPLRPDLPQAYPADTRQGRVRSRSS